MTPDPTDSSRRDISTEPEFNAALQELLLTAVANDIDPRGAWEYRNGPSAPDLEVVITELVKESPTD